MNLPIPSTPVIGTTLRVLGTTVTYLTSEQQTEGSYAMFELLIPLGEGMVPHRQELETEHFYVLEGRLSFRLDEEMHLLEAGQSIFVPRGAVHAYQSTGAGPTRVLLVVSPGFLHEKFLAELGMAADEHDRFLAEMGLRETTPKPEVNFAELVQTAAKYQIEMVALEGSL